MRGLLREGSGASETGKEAQSINKFKKKIASGLLQKERDRDKRKEKLHIFKVGLKTQEFAQTQPEFMATWLLETLLGNGKSGKEKYSVSLKKQLFCLSLWHNLKEADLSVVGPPLRGGQGNDPAQSE